MVGYFERGGGGEDGGGRETLPVGADCTLSPLRQELPPVNRLVCSPDIPVGAPADSSTAEATTTFRCEVCDKTFTQKTAFQNHARCHQVKESAEEPYRCNFCGKTFAVPARLTRHYRTHTGEKPYQCEYCKKSFSVKENLSVHRRIHTKERPYKCDICQRAFEHSGKLHRHMRIHTGERPHKCGVCSKTFIQSGQLVIHMRTHTGEKPYVCKDCGKGFTCSKQLKVHNRTHTGEKPYSCDICGKSFGYNHVLKLHQVAHYGEKVYKCTICNETFTSKKTMESHIKSHSEQPVVRTEEAAAAHTEAESSCASSTSDKPQGLDPALLAAVAVASSESASPYRFGSVDSSPERVLEGPCFEVTEPPVYLVPDPLASIQRKAPSVKELILPPRKRSKAILKSMETERELPTVRYSSVIQYAGAS
ncbi:hypothetical protein AAG570_001290 [Ranatra chinensis]|uniref:C2H2-type domain-containing protein n=1 Tax=Ranatra chinensis TaxID=642074 RepID=A0ABD0YBF9_9HEMI